VILRYPRALAVLEGSWTQIGGEPGFALIVYGDAGTLLVHQPRATREGQTVAAGRVQLVTAAGSELREPPPLSPDQRDGTTHFLARLADGRPLDPLCTPEVGRDAQAVLAAALRSAATGHEVPFPAAGQA
jgi:predicted dehydrogenase